MTVLTRVLQPRVFTTMEEFVRGSIALILMFFPSLTIMLIQARAFTTRGNELNGNEESARILLFLVSSIAAIILGVIAIKNIPVGAGVLWGIR